MQQGAHTKISECMKNKITLYMYPSNETGLMFFLAIYIF
jgi:hypothetical protein